MKKIKLLFIVLMLLMLGNSYTTSAQTIDIDWSNYARNIDNIITNDVSHPQYVYLYNVKSKQFITSGKRYGMQSIMTNVGMKFYITKDNEFYYVHSNVTTPDTGNGTCLSISEGYVYVDRSDLIYWHFYRAAGNETNPTYKILYGKDCEDWIGNEKHNWNGYCLYQDDVLKLNSSYINDNSCDWMIITRDDYLTVTADKKYWQTQIDVTGLLDDSRFDRNSNDAKSWKWGNGDTGEVENNNTSHAIGVAEAKDKGGAASKAGIDYGQYFAAEIDHKVSSLSQKVTGLKEGIYRITCQGFYYNNGDDNDNSYLYANTNTKTTGGKKYSGDESSILLNTYTKNFEQKVTNFYNNKANTFTHNRNLVAGKIFLDGKETNYLNEVYIYVHEGQTLTFGLNKKADNGYAFVDNFKLFYCGKNEIYLNEEGTEESFQADNINYPYPCRLNYRRAFTLGKWNAIVLPISLSGSQVRAAFGEDAQLSKLVGVDPARKSQILFKTVNLGTSGIEAGECYVIRPTKGPSVKMNDPYTFNNNNNDWRIYGPLYQIEGVTKKAGSPTKVQKEYTTTKGTLIFDGYYYQTSTTKDENVYYVNGGNMYYDNKGGFTIYATRWTLKDKANPGAKYTFNIDGINESVTAIQNINADGNTDIATSNTVYNLNGQVVRTNATSLEGLAKGIYIVNGKKYIVR
jgi:hypothetical protein